MSKGFRPGALALVIASEKLPECVGSTVVLKQQHFVMRDASGRYWLAPPGSAGVWAWEVEPNDFFPAGSGCIEKHLMPLKGDEDPLQIKDREIEHA